MARSITTILAAMDAEQAAQTGLSGLNSTSNSAIYTLWKYIVASQMFLQETLWDIFKVDLETIASKSPVGSAQWLQDKVFKFQYSATTPQVTQLIDFVPTYPTVDETLRIITRCSIKTSSVNTVDIKVAKSEPPVILTTPELNSLVGYISQTGDGTVAGSGVGIGFAGIYYNVKSYTADKLYLNATITYAGQYASTITANVLTAIYNYLANIPFDSNVKVISLVDAIQSVQGVTDVVVKDMAIRADTTAFTSKTYLVQSSATISSYLPTFAGYIVEETTSGETFTDKLIFVAQ